VVGIDDSKWLTDEKYSVRVVELRLGPVGFGECGSVSGSVAVKVVELVRCRWVAPSIVVFEWVYIVEVDADVASEIDRLQCSERGAGSNSETDRVLDSCRIARQQRLRLPTGGKDVVRTQQCRK